MEKQLSLFDVEQWRPVVDYEHHYAISSHGRVMRIKAGKSTRVGKILKTSADGGNYLQVNLTVNGKYRMEKIHRLVCVAFIGERKPGMQINHKDGNKSNNRLDNLEYCTRLENMQHAARMGLLPRGETNPRTRLSQEQVDEIRSIYAAGGITQTALAKRYGVGTQHISRLVHLQRRTN